MGRPIKKFVSRNKRPIIIIAIFALVGSFLVFRSFAANPNLPGDVNNDNKVTITDLSILLSNYGKTSTTADLNGDGRVTVTDLSILLTNFGKTYSGTPNPTPPGPSPPNPNPGTQPAITRDGTKLMRAGKQWKFAGMNADGWALNACRTAPDYEEPTHMTDANIDQYFRELNPHSVTRIWPYKGEANIPMLDKIVTAAEKYGQYLAPAFFDGNGGGTQCGSQRYGNTSANLALIEPVIKRYAKDTGTRKTNAIAFWEISNEIGCNDAPGWHAAIADGMKRWDPKTLVGTGTSPYSSSPQQIADCHRPASIDLISIHEYDNGCNVSHHGWKARDASKIINKPWYSGESGGSYSSGGDYTGGSGMGDCLKREWQAYIDAENSAGMLYWDFKMQPKNARASGADTATFIGGADVLWTAAKTFRHQYAGD